VKAGSRVWRLLFLFFYNLLQFNDKSVAKECSDVIDEMESFETDEKDIEKDLVVQICKIKCALILNNSNVCLMIQKLLGKDLDHKKDIICDLIKTVWLYKSMDAREATDFLLNELEKTSKNSVGDLWKCLLLQFKYKIGQKTEKFVNKRLEHQSITDILTKILDLVKVIVDTEFNDDEFNLSVEYLITELWNYTIQSDSTFNSSNTNVRKWLEICFQLSNYLGNSKVLYREKLMDAYGCMMEGIDRIEQDTQ